MTHRHVLYVLATLAAVSPAAHAFEFRTRFVQRVGNTDIPILNPELHRIANVPADSDIRIRLQFGVFDDETSPAPAGGIAGWNNGSILITGAHFSPMNVSRTPGRLAPFTFGPNGNGLPAQDPFTFITAIDNVIGVQSPLWPAGSDPENPPLPINYGVNDYASVYEVSLRTPVGYSEEWRFLDFSGDGYAVREWRAIGGATPPDADTPGQITYAPDPLPPIQFFTQLRVYATVPTPSVAAAALLACTALGARRRRV